MFNCVKDYFNEGVQSYRLNELAAYSVYNRYPLDLCLELKDIIDSDDNFFLEPMESKYWWNRIAYFQSVASDLSITARVKLVTDILREYGYTKHNLLKTIHPTKEEAQQGKKDTKISLHWFKKVSTGRE